MHLEGGERLILQAIRDLQGGPDEFVDDTRIAAATRMEISDVRDWLETLHDKGLISRVRHSQDYSAAIVAKGRQELRLSEPIRAALSLPPSSGKPLARSRIDGRCLVVGVSKYPAPITELPAVATDVQEVARLLGSENGSFRGEDVTPLVDYAANKSSILSALNKVFGDAAPDDTLFVYLAGHGAVQGGRFYFVAHDTKIGRLDTTGVPLEDIKSLFDRTKSQRAFLWLDFCHSGGLLSRGAATEADDHGVIERALRVVQGQGKLIMAACTPGQSAYEDPRIGHGLFTAALLRGLKGGAALDGEVTALSLFDYIDRQMGSDRQRPMLFGQATGRVVLMHYSSVNPSEGRIPRELDVDRSATEGGPRLYTVWFGTNRRPNDPADPARGYSAQRDDHVHYGTCQVAIPRSHHFGSVGSSWWRRWLRWTDDRLRVVSQAQMDPDAFWRALAASLQEHDADERQGLVFLHGYNVDFEEAAVRAAQIGFDLKVPGATAFFSWPSCGTVKGYMADEASIEASEPQIAAFLADFVARSGADRVHLVAHSMGNRGLLRALQRLAADVSRGTGVEFGQIILAAPDLDRDLFVNLAEHYARFSRRTTLYASPADRAVGFSRWLHGSPRVGLTPPPTVIPGVDTVEVPRFNIFDLFGHGYFAESEGLLHDIFDLIRRNPNPSDRQRLSEARTDNGLTYWVMNR